MNEIDRVNLLKILQTRFHKNMHRHPKLNWQDVENQLISQSKKLTALHAMELTGGEPDIIVINESSNEFIFYDCCLESPKLRRSFCYDREALESRKDHPPENNVLDMVKAIGAELLTEEEYRVIQYFGEFDLKTSSWVMTPPEIRKNGGAIFCDCRYGRVFTYHNGAQSYYASRGFRCRLLL